MKGRQGRLINKKNRVTTSLIERPGGQKIVQNSKKKTGLIKKKNLNSKDPQMNRKLGIVLCATFKLIQVSCHNVRRTGVHYFRAHGRN